ncbi:MAG TPA: alpha/beta hydrolase [Pyrinomonadaceae bacterium]|nr:alpha/beta hydrolase [Acidobacteriota bacterium]HQZ97028.1 alpha/beta hydrolase [Pyrinomonadaceae bacterium]
MPIFNAAGAEIYYETAGSGAPLVLIPGFASGLWSWFGQKDLEKDLQVISYDPRGIGRSRSEKNAPDLSLDSFAGDVLHILDELAIEKASVLGTSFGGFVALAFALRFPERVDKLILACTTAGGREHVSPDIEILRSFTRNPEYTVGEQIRRFFRPAFTEEFNREQAEIVEKVCRLREENEVDEETYVAQLRTAFAFDVSAQLGHINHEALVITGDRDNLVPMQNSQNLAAKLPNATLRVIKDGSHMIFVENAMEFNKLVVDFLVTTDNL